MKQITHKNVEKINTVMNTLFCISKNTDTKVNIFHCFTSILFSHLFKPRKICCLVLNMKLLLVCMLLTSQFITLLALRNVTKQVYCTKQISAFSSLESKVQDSKHGKLCYIY